MKIDYHKFSREQVNDTMAGDNVTLDLLLNKATSPALNDDDWGAISAFCDQVNKELDGAAYALRLLAHKMQSPTEREALCALSTIEACVRNCGHTFHAEIGKFRFLNEIIKLLSPKYLGNKTSERIKTRCVELLYSWHKGLPHQVKIGDAYKMLKSQKIVKEDPTYMDKTFDPFPPPKPRRADFEDEERSKQLSRLLKSKKPVDLQAANRLIKSMVNEHSELVEQRSRRITELEGITNQVKLLTEMVKYYSPTATTTAELEMMKELYDNLEKQRPKLFQLAGETEKESDAIDEILKVNDVVAQILSEYIKRIKGASENGEMYGLVRDTALLDLGFDCPQQQSYNTEQTATTCDILQSNFENFGFDDTASVSKPSTAPFDSLNELFISPQICVQPHSAATNLLPNACVAPLFASCGVTSSAVSLPASCQGRSLPYHYLTSMSISQQQLLCQPAYSSLTVSSLDGPSVFSGVGTSLTLSTTDAPVSTSVLADLDAIGKSLLEKNRSPDFFAPPISPLPKLTMSQLVANKTQQSSMVDHSQPASVSSNLQVDVMLGLTLDPLGHSDKNSQLVFNGIDGDGILLPSTTLTNEEDDSLFSPLVCAPIQTLELLPLTDMFVPLESVAFVDSIPPVIAYDKNGLKSMIHFTSNKPRADVQVLVLSTLSTNSKPVNNFIFQAAVPKTMKVKLQLPSSTVLPAFNPILPPMAMTQVFLIANPKMESVRLKFKITYQLGGQSVSDAGDVAGFPIWTQP